MELFLSSETFYAILSQTALALVWFSVGLLFYGWLTDRIVFEGRGLVNPSRLGPLDVAIAGSLTVLMLYGVISSLRASGSGTAAHEKLPGASEMISGLLISSLIFLVIVGGVLASLTIRNIRWREVFGFDRVSAGGVLGWAVMLLPLALPLIYGALILSQVALAANGHMDNSPQDLVRFLALTHSAPARVMVAISAVVLAPMQEEFIFRGYLHGTVRRYAGVTVGLLFNSALFALIHLHAPSFGGLFVLGMCLTLAYEWTGSLFVPMAMHALFNAVSVISLLHGTAH